MATKGCCDKLLVAAIDFGTTFSGYAFSFKHDHLRNPLDIKLNQWTSNNLVSNKTPTAILLDSNKKFQAFGYDAEKMYSELTFDDSHRDWYYFKRFKMELYKHGGLTRNLQIKDMTGKSMNAMTIVTMSIKFIKDQLINTIASRVTEISIDDIFWVVSVPAIWSDPAKQFMREAAVEAGIKAENLQLCLEPEAASIYCQYVPFKRALDGSGFQQFEAGTSYIVLDLGGGTADITIHQIMQDKSIRELHKASWGAWGGINVDQAFQLFLKKLFGHDTYEEFGLKNAYDEHQLHQDFEHLKRRVNGVPNQREVLRVPSTLMSEFSMQMGVSATEAIEQTTFKRQVRVVGDKLRVDADVLGSFFSETVDKIIKHVTYLLQSLRLKAISAILMVGGMSESPFVQTAIKKAFPEMQVIVPSDPELAVLKGSVLFGHNPSAISARVAKLTYGTAGCMPFDPSKHPANKKIILEKKELCDDCFIPFVKIGEILPINSVIGEKRFNTVRKDQKIACIPITTSTKPDPMYVSDPSCSLIGVIQINLSHENQSSESVSVLIKMIFGNVELAVEAREEKTDKVVSVTFDCLRE